MSQPRLWVDTLLLGLATVTGLLLSEVFYLLATNTGLLPADYACGTYLQPKSCLEINPSYQLTFLVSGGTIGFLFYFVNVMHKSKFALRLEIGFAAEGLLFAALWILITRYDPYFAETAYFVEIFVGSVVGALATFLAVDHVRSKTFLLKKSLPTPTLQNPN